MRLRAIGPAFAKQAARADSDFRLNDIVAGAQRVRVRIEQCHDALLLVIGHEFPEYKCSGHREHGERDHETYRQAGQHDDNHARSGDQQCRAEVRLFGDEESRHDDDYGKQQ